MAALEPCKVSDGVPGGSAWGCDTSGAQSRQQDRVCSPQVPHQLLPGPQWLLQGAKELGSLGTSSSCSSCGHWDLEGEIPPEHEHPGAEGLAGRRAVVGRSLPGDICTRLETGWASLLQPSLTSRAGAGGALGASCPSHIWGGFPPLWAAHSRQPESASL